MQVIKQICAYSVLILDPCFESTLQCHPEAWCLPKTNGKGQMTEEFTCHCIAPLVGDGYNCTKHEKLGCADNEYEVEDENFEKFT